MRYYDEIKEVKILGYLVQAFEFTIKSAQQLLVFLNHSFQSTCNSYLFYSKLTSALSSYSYKLCSTCYNISFTSTISSSNSSFSFLIASSTYIYCIIFFLFSCSVSHSLVFSSYYPVIVSALWVSSSNCLLVFYKLSLSTYNAFSISLTWRVICSIYS